jgi:hypothetical protein
MGFSSIGFPCPGLAAATNHNLSSARPPDYFAGARLVADHDGRYASSARQSLPTLTFGDETFCLNPSMAMRGA